MISAWLSWLQNRNVQQSQEPFNDQYKSAGGEEDWLEVITPAQNQERLHGANADRTQGQVEQQEPSANISTTTVTKLKIDNIAVEDTAALLKEEKSVMRPSTIVADTVESLPAKKLSRQERRAKARLATKEQKKQARLATLAAHYNRGAKGLGSGCLPAGPLTSN